MGVEGDPETKAGSIRFAFPTRWIGWWFASPNLLTAAYNVGSWGAKSVPIRSPACFFVLASSRKVYPSPPWRTSTSYIGISYHRRTTGPWTGGPSPRAGHSTWDGNSIASDASLLLV